MTTPDKQAGEPTPGPWIAKSYDPDEDGRLHWGVRQSPGAPSVSVNGEVLYCGLSICVITEQDMEDVENGEERANAELIALLHNHAAELVRAAEELASLKQQPGGHNVEQFYED